MNGVEKVYEYLLSTFFNEDGTLSDEEYFIDSILMVAQNTEYLYKWAQDSQRRSHTIAYEALIELLKNDLGFQVTSPQLKAAFKKLGVDFKEVLKPVVDEVDEWRNSLQESKEIKTEDVKYNVYVLAGGDGVYNSHLVDTVDSEEQAVDRVAEVGAEEGSNAYYVKVVNGKEVDESKKVTEGKLKKDDIISGFENYLKELDEEANELNLSDYMTDIFYDLEDEDDMNEANEAEEELKKKYNLKGDISDYIMDIDESKVTEAKDTDYIIVKQTTEGPLYMNGKSTSFDKKNAQIFNSEEEAREALHDYKENVVDPEANEFKIARLNEFKEQLEEGIEVECNQEDLIESVDIAKVMDQINELESQLEMMENEKDIDQAEVKKVKDKITRLNKKLDEAKMVEAIDNEKDEINLKEIRTILERSGIKSERTLDLMSKDILKDLKNNYADDCNIDGIFPGVVIVDAFQKKVEQITGKKPQLKFGEEKTINEASSNNKNGIFDEEDVKSYLGNIARVIANVKDMAKGSSIELPSTGELMNNNSVIVYELPIRFLGDIVGLGEEIAKQLLEILKSGKVSNVKCVPTSTKKGTVLTLSIIGPDIVEGLKESKFDKCQATLPLDAYHSIGIIVSDDGETVQYMYSNDEESVYESEIEYDEEGNPFFKDEEGIVWNINDFMRTNYGETKSKRIYANKEIEKPEILNEDLTAAEVLKRDLPIYLKTNEGYMELSIDEAPEKPEDYDEGYIAGWNKGEDPAFDAEQELKYKEAMDAFNEGEVYQFRQVADDIIYTICYGNKELDKMLRQLNATIVNIEDLMK